MCLTARATQALAMAVHELATNAAKYGSLSAPAGKLEVNWSVTKSRPDSRLYLGARCTIEFPLTDKTGYLLTAE